MTDWTPPEDDALFTGPDWEDPFPDWEWPEHLAGPEYRLALAGSMGWSEPGSLTWSTTDFYTPRARWVSDRE